MSALPWFRLYHRMIDDEKLRLLAFEDRWHFVALCCLKADGLLDEERSPLWERKVAVKLGVQLRELDEISRRLHEVGLIDGAMNPVAWDELQYRSDNSTARVQAFRERQKKQGSNSVKRFGNVTVTAQDTDTDTDTEEEKKKAPPTPKGVQRPDGVDPEVWADWKRVRKKAITATVLKRMETEAAKVGWTLAQAITEAAESGWQGFKAEYVKDRGGGSPRQAPSNANTLKLLREKLHGTGY